MTEFKKAILRNGSLFFLMILLLIAVGYTHGIDSEEFALCATVTFFALSFVVYDVIREKRREKK